MKGTWSLPYQRHPVSQASSLSLALLPSPPPGWWDCGLVPSTHSWDGDRRGSPLHSLKWNEMKVAQSCLTLCEPMNYTVHGILQARTLEWVAFPFSSGSSQPRDQTQVSCLAADSSPTELLQMPPLLWSRAWAMGGIRPGMRSLSCSEPRFSSSVKWI